MLKHTIQIIFALSCTLIRSQGSWTRLDVPTDLNICDIIARPDGTIYTSINGSQHIYQYNILEKKRVYTKLSRIVKTYPINNHDNLTLNFDFDSTLIAYYYRFGLYAYEGNNFVQPLLKDSNEIPRIYDLANIKFDKIGNLFFKEGNKIYKRIEKWSSKGEKVIYEQNGIIENFFPYSDSINYAIHDIDGITKIFKYNSQNGYSSELISLPYKINKNSIINEKGDMLLCVGQDLIYYINDEKKLLIPIIDSLSISNGSIEGVFTSMLNKAIICYKKPNFYVTYDSCKSWIKVTNLSKNIPKGELSKFIFWDTSTALLMINTSSCGTKKFYEITSETKQWKMVTLGVSNFNFNQSSIFKNEIIANNACFYMKSNNSGYDWSYMPTPFTELFNNFEHYIRKISIQNNGPIIFTFDENQDSLFRSIDFGNSWSICASIPKIKQIFRISQNELILLSSVGNIGNEKTNIYYSSDNGEIWRLNAQNTNLTPEIKNIKYDSEGNLIMYYIGSSSKVFKSIDKFQNWSQDTRFDRFILNEIFFEKDGRIIISGHDKVLNLSGLFASYDFKTFDNLSSNINNFVLSKFKTLGKGKYIGFAQTTPYKNEQGILYTIDDGINWVNISYNLPDFYSNEKIYELNDIIIDDQGNLYVSLTYDGIWKYNLNLNFSKYLDYNVNCEISPNPVNDNILITVPDIFQNTKINYMINDIVGRVLLNLNLLGSQTLDLSQFSPGTYFLKLSSDQKIIYSNKIIKF